MADLAVLPSQLANVWFSHGVQPLSDGFPTVHATGVPYGRLFRTNCQEQISIAYAQAVVTAARCKLEVIRIDDEKVDAVVRQEADHPLYDGATVDLQLKCTAQDVLRNDYIRWPLRRSHYDKLRTSKRIYPRILVIMLVPAVFESWVTQDGDKLQLVKCAYWKDLLGEPDVATESVTIKVPRQNCFNVEQLLGILSRVGAGGQP